MSPSSFLYRTMLSQFRSRELVPAPTEESSKQEPVAVPLQITKSFDEDQQAAARLTCDALCSLANGTNATSTTTAPSLLVGTPFISIALPSQPILMHGFVPQNAIAPTAATAGVLSLPKTLSTPTSKSAGATTISTPASNSKASTKIKACPKQHQLPLFLSKTYHMIDRCDPDVATWSATGDNFVVKNVEKFASSVLPMYFKHSNFSSFARQLNFYGFRKLRSDPILTNDVDPQTAAYVRFYHEKFQKDRPELLHSIKRATKSDQQSKDDVDDLKSQVFKLKKCVLDMSTQMERKISEMSYEYNRRISGLTAEYEKLTGLVAQLLQQQHNQFSQSSSPQHQQPHQQQHQQQHLLPKHVASPPSSHRVHDVPNPPLPPVVETTTTIPNISSATTSVNTCNSGGLSTTTGTISSSSLSSNTTATPPHTITSPTMDQEQQQQQKMQPLSRVVPMSLMENAGALLATATEASLNPGTTPSAAGGSSSNKRAHSDGVTTTGNAPPSVRVRTD